MLNHEQFRDLLLDYVYDLLDADQARQVDAHIQANPQARADVERARSLMAAAARVEFPAVRFEAPAAGGEAAITLPQPKTPMASPHQSARRSTMSGAGLRWAIAAGIVLVLGALAFPTAKHVTGYVATRARVSDAEESLQQANADLKNANDARARELADANKKVEDAVEQIRQINKKRFDDLQTIAREIQNKDTILEITGPPAVQPGAPNTFHVTTKRRIDGITVPARLDVRVMNEKKEVLYEEKDVNSQGMYAVHLPPDLAYTPNTQLALDVTASCEGRIRSELTEHLQWAAPRYVANLITDKPMYQPGQTVYFRSLTLNRASLQPPEEDFQVDFTITNPKGAAIFTLTGETRLRTLGPNDKEAKALLGPDMKPIRGIGAGEFLIPSTLDEGGEYTLAVRERNGRFPEEKRKFIINKYTPDRINKELDYHRKSYGPGDEVIANCKVWNEAGPLVNSPVVMASANIDGQEIPAQALGVTDSLGQVKVRFVLPTKIERGRASLSVTFTDGGANETIQKPVSIIVNKMFVDFYPEGGYIVAGVPNRVYFQAKTPLDKPADLKGRIVDSKGKEIAQVATLNDDKEPGANQGLGVTSFTPAAGEKYELKIDEPAGIEKSIPLPAVQAEGVVLGVPTGVSGPGESIRAEIAATGKTRNLLVGAYCRGRLLDHQRVQTEPGKVVAVELKPGDSMSGVVRVTVFEETAPGARQTLTPRAERLVYRKSGQAVKFTVTPDKSRYAPGERPSITISATDEKGNPVRAIATVSVVNQTVVTMADEKSARALPTHFAFVGEVRKAEDLEHADFLLGDHPKAAQVLDLLLGTQGWRRFAEQNPQQFRRDNQQEAERILVMNGQVGRRVINNLMYRQQEIEATFAPKLKDLQTQLKQAIDEKISVDHSDAYAKFVVQLQKSVDDRRGEYRSALVALAPYDETNRTLRTVGLPALAGLALVLSLALLIAGLVRGVARTSPVFVTAAGSLAASILLLAAFGLTTDSGMPGTAQRGNATVAQVGPDFGNAVPMEGMPEMARMADGKADRFDERMNRDGVGGGRGGMQPPMAPRMMPKAAKPLDAPAGPVPAPAAIMPADPKPAAPAPRPAKPDAMAMQMEKNNLRQAVGDAKAMDDVVGRRMADKAKNLEGGFEMAKKARDPKGEDMAFRKQMKEQVPANRRGDAMYEQKLREALAKDMPAGEPFGGAGGGGGFGRGPVGGRPGAFGPGGGPAGGFAPGMPPPVPTAEPFLVREFAHVNLNAPGAVRNDRTETVYWNPALVLDETCRQKISFSLSDDITKFRVLVAGHTLEGRIGAATHVIESRKPFGLEAKLPVEITAGDKLDIPVLLTNDSDDQRHASVAFAGTGLEIRSGSTIDKLMLKPNERARSMLRLQSSIVEGQATLKLDGKGEPFASDTMERTVTVVPDGFPAAGSYSDLLEKVARHELTLPKDYVKGTLKVWANMYPSTLADLQKGLEGLLREPYGCFEQTSTSNYPNTLILNYLKESGESNPAALQRAQDLLGRGYQKLTSFECQKSQGGREGYEWFGGMAPPHEALTAYGLLQFKDMASVHSVDQEMVERTRKYLLSRRKPDGGFERNARALDTFGRAPDHITNAYIVWALSETGKEDLSKEIDKLLKDQPDSKDPYFLSLVANALLNCEGADRTKQAIDLLIRVKAQQAADGGLNGAETSITRSGGRDLRIETTALAMLAWLKANQPKEFTESLRNAVRWLGQQRGGYGGFGSTQSTILALKALIAFTKASKKTAEGGELILFVNDKEAGRTRFLADRQEAIAIDVKEPEKLFQGGKNELRLELAGKNSYPFTIGWSYSALTPISAEKCQVKLTTKLDKQQAKEGDAVRLTATIENLGGAGKGQPMTLAVIGLPAGLKVPEDMKQLKEMATLRKGEGDTVLPGEISFFEIRGRELVLYWRDLKPGAKFDIAIDLIADIPGEYRGPASRAYLYYTADDKHWVEPLKIAIEARE